MLRFRLAVAGCPRRALVLTDTPRPDCLHCAGEGGHSYDYGDYDTGEYAGSHWEFCDCWTARSVTLLPLPRWPRWLRRRHDGRDPWGPNGYSNEPPF
ncbi:hypothetical protein NFX46_39325 [Streptomyces phaeoluteigriseus]|uniref:Uncharacterized protein n=1 Tax=Streptomyces phaeoluteigriseus TaxID=114686 RepID=A0ABY4ZJZ2_9ACTN|nr:hypothetical protein [Streptomyces phaeoluteigriseus]USQ89260.1 hypothetical protein NFX46_39325 [Streptomyces phaeoluteigriseus]